MRTQVSKLNSFLDPYTIFSVKPSEKVRLETPGGGGFGAKL